VTTGRRGAMYGVGLGIVLALVYWMAMSVFGALGSGGVIIPMLAAWRRTSCLPPAPPTCS